MVLLVIQTQIDSKQATIGDGDLTIARTSGLQATLDGKQELLEMEILQLLEHLDYKQIRW